LNYENKINELTQTKDAIVGLIALLPLLTVILFYVDVVGQQTSMKIVVVLGVTLSTYYGILKFARPLAEESKDKRKVI